MSGAVVIIQSLSSSRRSAQEREECVRAIEVFNGKTATIEQKQQYAECVRAVHPHEGSSAVLLLLFIGLTVAFISLAVLMHHAAFGRFPWNKYS